jgi:tight adherence protein B
MEMSIPVDTRYWTFMGLAALSMGLLVWGLYALWREQLDPRQRMLHTRLRSAAAAESAQHKGGVTTPTLRLRPRRLYSSWPLLDAWLRQTPGLAQLDRGLVQTGLAISATQALLLTLSLALLGWAAAASLGMPTALQALVALVGPLCVVLFLQQRRHQRMALIEQALPDALDLMARSMQAGHAFTSALQVTAKDCPAPLSHELRTVFEEINFGVGTAQALQALSGRVASDDVRYFVVAVVVQSETGGNLAEILTNTARLIRERQKIAGVVRVLSAEGRISALVLAVLPFALAAFLALLNPAFISKLWTDPMGLQMVYASLLLMALGMLWMWKLIQIRV